MGINKKKKPLMVCICLFLTAGQLWMPQAQAMAAAGGTGNGQVVQMIKDMIRADHTGRLDAMLRKVKVLRSRSDAVKAAVRALKEAEYSMIYYSSDPYDDIFAQILRQHPEYDYGTSVWRGPNGTYGYQRSSLTKDRQKEMMAAADSAAKSAVNKCIEPNMTDEQKAKAIHDHIVKNCQYGGYQTEYTAYGALVDGNAVCRGYAAAFNLMASKCGLLSMAVCGVTMGGEHVWTYAKIGEQYRYIDCTWDDTGTLGTGIVYTYFNVTAEKMREEHVWDEAAFPASAVRYSKYFQMLSGLE